MWIGDHLVAADGYDMSVAKRSEPKQKGATMLTVKQCADDLDAGLTSSVDLVGHCIERIKDPSGEGARTYIRRFDEQALRQAAALDQLRAAELCVSSLAGIPISVKDLFDIKGTITTAGSLALRQSAPAECDAPVVRRLKAAGAIILGTTNMTEFAMGGLGLNPHYGTPRNPFARQRGLIPGGSSSGAAVSVTDGMAVAAIGTDTAGSVRMPAALCGIVGYKPTARRVPAEGSVPLAVSLDSVGVLARTLACCESLDAVISDAPSAFLEAPPLRGLRFAIPTTVVLDDMDDAVARAFSKAMSRLSEAGALIVEMPFPVFAEIAALNGKGGFSVAEGYAWHRQLLEERGDTYDPIIASRLRLGKNVSGADYQDLVAGRARVIAQAAPVLERFDALLMPTVPITAPEIAAFDQNEELWLKTNRLLIRNPGMANFLDACALTLPCQAMGDAPVGLSLMAGAMRDSWLFAIGRSVEAAISPHHV
jgi:aspartyl-tRNA(Asn)/glutamyl-tRNA(Gln) amidotransferase subunit A